MWSGTYRGDGSPISSFDTRRNEGALVGEREDGDGVGEGDSVGLGFLRSRPRNDDDVEVIEVMEDIEDALRREEDGMESVRGV